MAQFDITLPTFHAGQVNIYKNRSNRNAVRCGRRWGKSMFIVTLAADAAIKGQLVGIFTPTYRQWVELWDQLVNILYPITLTRNKSDSIIKLTTGGSISFWYLNDNPLAGRGRSFDMILLDEIAFSKNSQMTDIWRKAIVPTMATRPEAVVWACSTPLGIDPDNFFFAICQDPEFGFTEHHAPSSGNPLVSAAWLEEEKLRLPPDVFTQELLGEFIDWSGVAFFGVDKLLVDGQPIQYPTNCDTVFAVIDSAMKSGVAHDGTAILYCARNKYAGHPVVILDYDVISIDADLLTSWLPDVVLPRLDELSRQCGAREGSRGVFIEDKASGIAIVQHAKRRGWPVTPIDAKFTSIGKDERALAVSSHHHQGLCKITEHAYNKTVMYKGSMRNHLLSQIGAFRLGDKDAYKRADDLLDCFTYALALALGSAKGYS